jgi:hypothetical protein
VKGPVVSDKIQIDQVVKFVEDDPYLDGPALSRIFRNPLGFLVLAQPVACLAGTESPKFGVGPIIIAEQTGEVFRLSDSQLALVALAKTPGISLKYFRMAYAQSSNGYRTIGNISSISV